MAISAAAYAAERPREMLADALRHGFVFFTRHHAAADIASRFSLLLTRKVACLFYFLYIPDSRNYLASEHTAAKKI